MANVRPIRLSYIPTVAPAEHNQSGLIIISQILFSTLHLLQCDAWDRFVPAASYRFCWSLLSVDHTPELFGFDGINGGN